MKMILRLLLALWMSVAVIPFQAFAGLATVSLVGLVADSQGHPIPGVKVIVKNTSGKILGEAPTDQRGHYMLHRLYPGQYQLTLDPQKTPFRGQTVVASLPPEGLTVDWTLLQGAAAMASAQTGAGGGGLFGLGDAGTVLLINVLGGGFGTGMAAAFGGFDTNTRHVSSPSM